MKRLCYLLLTLTLLATLPQSTLAEGNPKSLTLNEQGVAAVKAQQFSKAEDLFKQAIAIDGGNLTAVFNLAGMYLTNKKEQQAIHLLKDYVVKYPKDPALFARLGDAYFGVKDLKNAIANYEKALTLDESTPTVAQRLGTVYVLTENLEKAEKMYNKAVAANPRDGQLLANLSSLQLANGKPQDSITTAKRALQIKATSEVYITMGNAYEALKDYKNSLIAFERAADLGDERKELTEKITALKKMAG